MHPFYVPLSDLSITITLWDTTLILDIETNLGELGHSSGRNINLILASDFLMQGQIHCVMYVRSKVSSTTEGTLNIFLWLFTLTEKIIVRILRSKVNSRIWKSFPSSNNILPWSKILLLASFVRNHETNIRVPLLLGLPFKFWAWPSTALILQKYKRSCYFPSSFLQITINSFWRVYWANFSVWSTPHLLNSRRGDERGERCWWTGRGCIPSSFPFLASSITSNHSLSFCPGKATHISFK